MCLDQAVIVDPGPEFDVLRLITHLCVVNTSNGGMIVNIWFTEHVQGGRSATPPPQLVYHRFLEQCGGIEMLKSYGGIPVFIEG
jgi:hypothetical protein